MTSRHNANSRQPESPHVHPRAFADHASQRVQDGKMDDKIVTAIVKEAHSDYGSDVELQSLPAPSDYGSEIDLNDVDEDTLLGDILVKLAASAPKEILYPSVETDGQDEGVVARQKRRPGVHWEERAVQSSPVAARSASMEIENDVPSRRAFSVPREKAPSEPWATSEPSPGPDARTPLERFRTKPKKPLSVTDLVSPAWCELQFFYNLSKFGRKPRTQAMKTGSKIHQALEDEVHTAVPVHIETKEDRFGLRIWNAIQGLRCLRDTGLTRELEVWGIVEGQVVNGVIDELSFTCPDPHLEEKLELSKAQQSGGTLPLGQPSIEQAFQEAGCSVSGRSHHLANARIGPLEANRRVYVSDVKTRGVRSLPTRASLRPTWMQLMLYRRLLESLSLNTVDAETILARYSLAPLQSFSEEFMLSGGAIGNDAMEYDPENPYSILQSNELRSYPNLLSLWSLMISEFQQTIPSISDILRAEFRYARSGEVIGNELMVYSAEVIDTYVKEGMDWWHGVREARGVEIEEAFKCRLCDFADECSWRKTKIEEATEKHRLRREAREKSAV
ncbi:hypothetical protein N0V90_002210 [Kalmusia sp. IMI 367209]|nr:hypothetical protein N0V90_002210 [Kalmusia sp. IMI 367209]